MAYDIIELREKLNAIVHYLWRNARDQETLNLRWFTIDNIKIAGISQTELSSLLIKLDRCEVLEKIEKPGYGAGYSFMYRIGHLTDAQIRQRIDKGLAAILAQAAQSAAHKILRGRAAEEFTKFANRGIVEQES